MQSNLYPDTEVYAPMLISKTPEKKKLEKELHSGNYIVQPKKDGYFYQLVKNKAGKTFLFSRSKSRKTGFFSEKIDCVPHIKEWAEELPPSTTLIGEIYYPGKKSNDTTRIMGCLPKTAIARQKGEFGPIHYYIHDILEYDGHSYLDKGFEYRYDQLMENLYPKLAFTYLPYWEIAPTCSRIENIDTYIEELMEQGEEGVVVKLKSGLYMPGKRPTYNFKIKQQVDNIDLIVTKLLDPERDYTGKTDLNDWPYWDEELHIPVTKAYYYKWKNAMEVSGYINGELRPVGRVASGLTDEMKKEMAEHPEKYLGSVVELQAMSWTADGALRHPRFIRMRSDKNPEECII